MSPPVLGLRLATIALDTAGQLAFKAASAVEEDGLGQWRAMASRHWLWLGIGFCVGEFFLWLAFLSLVPLSEGVLLRHSDRRKKVPERGSGIWTAGSHCAALGWQRGGWARRRRTRSGP